MNTHKPRIAIIGAGPMGLGVGYELAKKGIPSVIYEADNRIGGMTASMDFNGIEIERFYHFHCTSDTYFEKVLNELDIHHMLHWRSTKMGYWFNGILQAWGNPVALLKFRGLTVLEKLRYGGFAFYCTKLKNWKELDKIYATAWLKKWVGDSVYDKMWRALFEYKFYEFKDSLSAAWIWARIRRVGQSRSSLMQERLGYLEGGSQTLLNALKVKLEDSGVEFQLSTAITDVGNVGDKYSISHSRGSEQFDIVISTIPLPFVPKVIGCLTETQKRAYSDLENVGVACVILNLDSPVSDNFWVNVNDPDFDVPGFVEYTNLRSLGDAHIVYVPYYMPVTNKRFSCPDQEFVEDAVKLIAKVNPSITGQSVKASRVSRYRWAQPVCHPKFLDSLPTTNIDNKSLWVADTSHYYPEDRGISESLEFGSLLAIQAVEKWQQAKQSA